MQYLPLETGADTRGMQEMHTPHQT